MLFFVISSSGWMVEQNTPGSRLTPSLRISLKTPQRKRKVCLHSELVGLLLSGTQTPGGVIGFHVSPSPSKRARRKTWLLSQFEKQLQHSRPQCVIINVRPRPYNNVCHRNFQKAWDGQFICRNPFPRKYSPNYSIEWLLYINILFAVLFLLNYSLI